MESVQPLQIKLAFTPKCSLILGNFHINIVWNISGSLDYKSELDRRSNDFLG